MDYYYSFKKYLKKRHNKKIWRIPLSTGYPCPNRINGNKGCTFCDGFSFIAPYMKNDSIEEQLKEGIDFFGNKFNVEFFYGYFQENTGTFGNIDDLINKYEYILKQENILGLIISTRPDYINHDIIEKIKLLRNKYNKDVWIEMGLQSVYDKTLKRVNRNHTYDTFKYAVKVIKENSNIKIGVHMILGLPGETPDMMKNSILTLFQENDVDGIKLRLLDILPGAEMEKDYMNNKKDFYVFSNNEYISLICDIFERIPENIVIMRTLNYNPVNILNKDEKILTKDEILIRIRDEFKKRGTRQGSFY